MSKLAPETACPYVRVETLIPFPAALPSKSRHGRQRNARQNVAVPTLSERPQTELQVLGNVIGWLAGQFDGRLIDRLSVLYQALADGALLIEKDRRRHAHRSKAEFPVEVFLARLAYRMIFLWPADSSLSFRRSPRRGRGPESPDGWRRRTGTSSRCHPPRPGLRPLERRRRKRSTCSDCWRTRTSDHPVSCRPAARSGRASTAHSSRCCLARRAIP